MLVAESTHWDPDWLFTSTQYFRFRVRRTLDRVIEALVAEPRRIFSLECVFFPNMYWEARPQQREVFRQLANEGRLRFTGSGVTTPDTLLPEDESLLRDLLVGQEWLRSRGIAQEPRVLYLPDSFGHSPGTPSLLAAAGVPYAAVCRIDGMRFPGADWEPAAKFPRPGTSAAQLIAERTADFVWRGPDGSEVLSHWHTYGYSHGDLIGSGGLSRVLGLPTAWPDRRERHVARRIEGYIEQLSPLARTPYLLLAIGSDFVDPVPRLLELLDRWNDRGYERTGVWLVSAGIDDYLDLVSHHRDVLPTISLDPNPYWMGFYASRPGLKRACRDLGRRLVARDNELAKTALAGVEPSSRTKTEEMHAAAWWIAATSNHHDFVTGTAPDRVTDGEQLPWLRTALASTPWSDTGDAAIAGARAPHDQRREHPPCWARDGTHVTVTTADLTAVFDESLGGALVSLVDASGIERVSAPSLELRSYAESGGLWRMGNEFHGGRWAIGDRTTSHPAQITATTDAEGVRLSIRGALDGRPTEIVAEFGANDTSVRVRSSVTAPDRRTITLATHQSSPITNLLMHQPGGVVMRPLERWYRPTFWPLHSFAGAMPDSSARTHIAGLALAVAVPTALHASVTGCVEIVVARTATKEVAFGFVPVLAPAKGHERGTQVADIALQWLDRPDTAAVIAAGRKLLARVDRAAGRREPAWLVETTDPLIEVIAVKRADRGDGIVVRLRNWAAGGPSRAVALSLAAGSSAEIFAAGRADSRERDLDVLPVRDGAVRFETDRYLTTVRLLAEPCSSSDSRNPPSRCAYSDAKRGRRDCDQDPAPPWELGGDREHSCPHEDVEDGGRDQPHAGRQQVGAGRDARSHREEIHHRVGAEQ